MDEIKELFHLLERQKQLLRAAQGRKGQRPTDKSSRMQLLIRFSSMAIADAPKTNDIKSSLIGYAYPPSTIPFAGLKPMTLSDLRLETHHLGRVLVVRTFGQPIRFQSVQNAVEDKNFDVDQLAIYDAAPDVAPFQVLPKDTVLAIKEPFYKTSASGDYIIRIDHPSDLIRLRPGHPLVPSELAPRIFELEQEAIESKNNGNAAFKRKDFLAALEEYTCGLNACSESDSALKFDLYRNRSIVNTHLQRYEHAVKDAIAALIPNADGDKKKTQDNVKALYRAGKASYCLNKFSSAKSYFEQLLQTAPDDKDGREQMCLTEARLKEFNTGAYDFSAMSDSVNPRHTRLNHATFSANVVVRAVAGKGRGLFSTKDIKAGDLVLVEKAFCAVFKSECASAQYIMLNVNTNSGRMGPHAFLYWALIQKSLHNQEEAKRVLDLFDGNYTPKCTAPEVDGVAVIDTFQLAAILDHNVFGCADTRSVDEDMKPKKAAEGPSDSVGIWITASYMNHACLANAHRSFLGDMMILRAIKDIAKDEEITISYANREFHPPSFQERLQRTWKFTCTCSICSAEAIMRVSQRKELAILMKQVDLFLKKHRGVQPHLANNTTIKEANTLAKKLECAYDEKVFQNVPRLAFAKVNARLCAAYVDAKNVDKIAETAQLTLQNLGYNMKISRQIVSIDRAYAYFEPLVIDVAMYAAHACSRSGKLALGKQWEMFAKESYLIDKGEMRGFAERYG